MEELYLQGEYLADIALKFLGKKELGYLVKQILINRGVHIRNRSEVKQLSDIKNSNFHLNGRIYHLNENYFKEWSPNMAYLLGYIATDGCVYSNELKLGLQQKDESLLYLIKQELGYDGPVKRKKIKNKKIK